jgi:hypothetical protein
MRWLEDKTPIPDDWKRESRESVSYARQCRLEEIYAQLVMQEKKENYVVIFPDIENDITESGLRFAKTGWPEIRSTIFDLRSNNLFMKHTKNIAYETFNRLENLWGDARTHPHLKYCATTNGTAKFTCSVDKIELAKQIVFLSTEVGDEETGASEQVVLEFFDVDTADGSYKKRD